MSKLDPKKVITHLKEKWEDRPCPMCNAKTWSVTENIQELREFHEKGFNISGPIIPVIPVICNNCGNTFLLNAVILGLITPKKEQEK